MGCVINGWQPYHIREGGRGADGTRSHLLAWRDEVSRGVGLSCSAAWFFSELASFQGTSPHLHSQFDKMAPGATPSSYQFSLSGETGCRVSFLGMPSKHPGMTLIGPLWIMCSQLSQSQWPGGLIGQAGHVHIPKARDAEVAPCELRGRRGGDGWPPKEPEERVFTGLEKTKALIFPWATH